MYECHWKFGSGFEPKCAEQDLVTCPSWTYRGVCGCVCGGGGGVRRLLAVSLILISTLWGLFKRFYVKPKADCFSCH